MKTNVRTVSTPRGADRWFAEIHNQLDAVGAIPSRHQDNLVQTRGPSTIYERAKVDEVIGDEVRKGEWS
jgi:hypothetical protein